MPRMNVASGFDDGIVAEDTPDSGQANGPRKESGSGTAKTDRLPPTGGRHPKDRTTEERTTKPEHRDIRGRYATAETAATEEEREAAKPPEKLDSEEPETVSIRVARIRGDSLDGVLRPLSKNERKALSLMELSERITGGFDCFGIDGLISASVVYRIKTTHPEWLKSIPIPEEELPPAGIKESPVLDGALLLLRIEDCVGTQRLFAVAYGSGGCLLEPSSADSDFGRLVLARRMELGQPSILVMAGEHHHPVPEGRPVRVAVRKSVNKADKNITSNLAVAKDVFLVDDGGTWSEVRTARIDLEGRSYSCEQMPWFAMDDTLPGILAKVVSSCIELHGMAEESSGLPMGNSERVSGAISKSLDSAVLADLSQGVFPEIIPLPENPDYEVLDGSIKAPSERPADISTVGDLMFWANRTAKASWREAPWREDGSGLEEDKAVDADCFLWNAIRVQKYYRDGSAYGLAGGRWYPLPVAEPFTTEQESLLRPELEAYQFAVREVYYRREGGLNAVRGVMDSFFKTGCKSLDEGISRFMKRVPPSPKEKYRTLLVAALHAVRKAGNAYSHTLASRPEIPPAPEELRALLAALRLAMLCYCEFGGSSGTDDAWNVISAWMDRNETLIDEAVAAGKRLDEESRKAGKPVKSA